MSSRIGPADRAGSRPGEAARTGFPLGPVATWLIDYVRSTDPGPVARAVFPQIVELT